MIPMQPLIIIMVQVVLQILRTYAAKSVIENIPKHPVLRGVKETNTMLLYLTLNQSKTEEERERVGQRKNPHSRDSF